MRKRMLLLSIALVSLVMILAAQSVWSKAHVPKNQVQICHQGKAMAVDSAIFRSHLGHGDCQLPVCDFNNVFQVGDECPAVDLNQDRRCDLALERDDAGGKLPLCAPGTF